MRRFLHRVARALRARADRWARRFRERWAPLDFFLARVSSVVHVGANEGQERELYHRHGLSVVWIEPIPDVFERLCANVRDLPAQRAIQALVTDRDGAEYEFHVSNNAGLSSSILELDGHRELWPEIHFDRTIPLRSTTLAALERRGAIRVDPPAALVLDTQGSELLVLQGAGTLLDRFQYVKLEAADFEAYRGCCRVADLSAFLAARGFRERRRALIRRRPGVGAYYDLVYERRAA